MTTTLISPLPGARPFADYAALPASTIEARTWAAKRRLGKRAVILGHHYQRESVIQFADFRGDSFKLSQLAAGQAEAEFIIFCGVHFMAESADILRQPHQTVILPDIKAGCSMADMAASEDVEEAWDRLARAHGDSMVPVTYMNSSAALKAFCGERGGVVCTSSNARAVLDWAWREKTRVFFFPDQHLGRNTAFAMCVALEQMAEWDYRAEDLERANAACYRPETRLILWRGFCSVHTKFTLQQVREVRAEEPRIQVLVHPECPFEVVRNADLVGSTEFIIEQVRNAPPGTQWAIGTEINLVHRLALEHPDQGIRSLQKNVCPCATMNRIDPAHLLWALENLADGHVVNAVRVAEAVKDQARVALDRMLSLRGGGPFLAKD
jgi:quinolinate synthase